jgi:glycosyltransferase 2 family protein
VRRKGAMLGLLLTAVFLGLAFYRVDFVDLYAALAAANYLLLVPAALCTLLGYVLRTARWRVNLAEAAACPFVDLFGILMSGFAVNNILPARLGEFARVYSLRRRTGVRKTFLFASVFLERAFDGLILVGILVGLSLVLELPGWSREVEAIAGGFFLLVAVGVVILLAQRGLVERILQAILAPFPDRVAKWTSGAFGAFLMGLSTMRRPSALFKAAVLSVGVWSLEWASYFILATAFPLGLSLAESSVACALLLAVVNLGIMLPSSPGYVGTFQFFAVAALSVFGVPREPALAMAIVAHLSQYVLVTGIGVAFFGREHVSLRGVRSDADEERSERAAGTGAAS